ncbi:hypothetical protein QQG09_00960 [Melissococcus plutonius]|uniref:Uncharacterized protein n=2 Tax=Melissococcus plutonius TaxID=33970 RepID=F3YC37_MELPT|nr:hypothetical protein [Melissococcus plutonius]BAL61690.1 hypothetical protein MPD5_0416 [Melissococcus plutonius DAT561]AIM25946.1 hypothetical protein MEPL_c015000 [Melissococcus plutonius S1]KMT24008.1 hypothetical protein MEPL2_3c02220 [Melissococcus plutonius]KMT24162.1 hypothetical protein MEPL3_7c00310 [Melissococcus plutonius]KMT25507.1 hypothetical protein MEPL1_7c00310 [Melissococcus plutonius]
MDEKARADKLTTYIMDRTKPEDKENMQRLLSEIMEKKSTNQLNKMYLMGVMPRALSYLNPDDVKEVKDAVGKFLKKYQVDKTV